MAVQQNRLEQYSEWYLKEQLDFDKRLIRFRYETLKPFLNGPEGLEMGPAEGNMTQFLVHDFKRLTLVEGSKKLLDCIPDRSNLVKIHALFEDFEPITRFNTIIMDHILEHVENPSNILTRVKKWLTPDGRMLLGVPNGHSIHRLTAVKMGLLKQPCQLNERDKIQGHYRVYNPESFRQELQDAGLQIWRMGGVFYKPLSNQQIQDHWTNEMIQGFYELGKDFPEYAADLFAVCEAG